MPTLEWIGKDKVINHHLDVPYRVLERKYSYDEGGQHEEDNGSENMIIHITPATRAGFTTTTSMTRESRSGSAKLSEKRAKTFPAMTNGFA